MLKISGNIIQNFPKGMEDCLDKLMLGVVQSQCMHFLKTTLEVYGRNEEEIIEYAKNIKQYDSTYDIVDIYTDVDEDSGERNFKRYRQI